jgi:hypothetical protein
VIDGTSFVAIVFVGVFFFGVGAAFVFFIGVFFFGVGAAFVVSSHERYQKQ